MQYKQMNYSCKRSPLLEKIDIGNFVRVGRITLRIPQVAAVCKWAGEHSVKKYYYLGRIEEKVLDFVVSSPYETITMCPYTSGVSSESSAATERALVQWRSIVSLVKGQTREKVKDVVADRMRVPKMAELQFEAPLASIETEDWNEFNEFQTAKTTDDENCNKDTLSKDLPKESNDNSVAENFGETFSGSLEDLVNSFDEKISKCFCNFEEQVDKFAPVQIRTQEEIVNDCQWVFESDFVAV